MQFLTSDKAITIGKRIRVFRDRTASDRALLLIILPVIAYFVIFHYLPMYGAIIAFKKFIPGQGILQAEWAGFKYFEQFFDSIYFTRLIRNTLVINLYGLLFGFPIPVIFALMINELKDNGFKKTVQTVSYLPHFISVVVIVGMIVNFFSVQDGVVNIVIKSLGGTPVNFMTDPKYFRTLYVGSGIWQEFGWGSIIYLAALSGIDPQMYEASQIDGASRWQQMRHITIPGIMPTVIIMLILSVGNMMSLGFEKIILMYNPATYEVSDIISSYTYRRGILNADYSFGAAVGLFNSATNFVLLISVNLFCRRFSKVSLW